MGASGHSHHVHCTRKVVCCLAVDICLCWEVYAGCVCGRTLTVPIQVDTTYLEAGHGEEEGHYICYTFFGYGSMVMFLWGVHLGLPVSLTRTLNYN